jgi:uncharacterized protein YdaU (DUF1376 family)
MNYYQFHVGDYISHTAHLDPIEDLAFRRLLDLYYQSESPIPNETKMVSKRIRLGSHEQEVINVLSEFFELIDGYWHHSRCDKEILAYQVKSERNREVGKLGGRPKKNPEETIMVISGNPNETLTKNQEPRTINQEPNNKFAPLNALIAHGVNQDVAKDFLAVRKAKKAPLTKTALSGIISQSSEAGMTLQQALETCVQRNWQSFKAEWIAKEQPQKTQTRVYL